MEKFLNVEGFSFHLVEALLMAQRERLFFFRYPLNIVWH